MILELDEKVHCYERQSFAHDEEHPPPSGTRIILGVRVYLAFASLEIGTALYEGMK
ncbi:MAG: hypothetical protein ABSH25_06425 [Syntrophorhabdales bacterium]